VNRPRPGRSFNLPTLYAHAAPFQAAGLQLARVLVTDSDKQARRFFAASGRSTLLIKGCAGRPAMLDDDALLSGGVNCLVSVPKGVRRRIHVVGEEAFGEIVGDDNRPLSAEYLLAGPLAERCCAVVSALGLHFLELLVVSGIAGDVVIGASDLPEAVFGEPSYRRRVAGALSKLLVGQRREA
jgi:hypothetical protein